MNRPPARHMTYIATSITTPKVRAARDARRRAGVLEVS